MCSLLSHVQEKECPFYAVTKEDEVEELGAWRVSSHHVIEHYKLLVKPTNELSVTSNENHWHHEPLNHDPPTHNGHHALNLSSTLIKP
jgi:hypothetical protein